MWYNNNNKNVWNLFEFWLKQSTLEIFLKSILSILDFLLGIISASKKSGVRINVCPESNDPSYWKGLENVYVAIQ